MIAHTQRENLQDLLARVRRGDRDAAARLLDLYGDRIRRHLRLRLSTSMRRVYDSLDVMSSLERRLDYAVANQQVTFRDEADVLRYLKTVADHAAVDHARVASKLRAADTARASTEHGGRVAAPLDEEQVVQIIEGIDDSDDRFILCSWLNDRPHRVTAQMLGLSQEAVRMRLSRLIRRLRDERAHAPQPGDN